MSEGYVSNRLPSMVVSVIIATAILLCFTGTASAQVSISVTPANGAGFSAETVYPGANRSFFSFVSGSANLMANWSYSCVETPSGHTENGLATDVTYLNFTVPISAGTCTITATSQADGAKSASSKITVLSENVSVNIIPFYLVVYKNQYVNLQSYVSGTSTKYSDVTWSVSGPAQGTVVGATTDRDFAWYSDVAGTYTITATSTRDNTKTGSATVIVTAHDMPYQVTNNGTMPVDCTCVGEGRCIDIGGNGSSYNTMGDWFAAGNTLSNGDTMRLWTQHSPYHEELIIDGTYSPTQPFRMCGVPDASGNLPEINGANATAANPANAAWGSTQYNFQQYGLINVRNMNYYSAPPQYVVIEGLKIKQAQANDQYVLRNTSTKYYYGTVSTTTPSTSGGSCVRVQNGQDVVIRGNDISKCGAWGVFTNALAPEGKMVRRIFMEGNYLHDNGTANNFSMHNAYMQADGVVIQFNWFGHNITGSNGSTLKTRSSGLYVRYNHLLAQSRVIDFVEPQDAASYFLTYVWWPYHNSTDPNDPTPIGTIASTEEHLANVYAYGNTLWTGDGYCQNCVHYGWDMIPAHGPGGTMWYYHNTFQSAFTSATYGWNLWDDGKNDSGTARPTFPHAQILNNVIYRNPEPASGPTYFSWAVTSGAIGTVGKNWIDSSWGAGSTSPGYGNNCQKVPTGYYWQNPGGQCNLTGISGTTMISSGAPPVDAVTYTPSSSSGVRSAAAALPTEIAKLPPKFMFFPQTRLIRVRGDGLSNLGAIAYDGTPPPLPPSLASIAVTPSSVSINTGATSQLTATCTMSDFTTNNCTSTVTWNTSDATKATVVSGLVSGIAPGSESITATSGEVASSAVPVTVNYVPQPPSSKFKGAHGWKGVVIK